MYLKQKREEISKDLLRIQERASEAGIYAAPHGVESSSNSICRRHSHASSRFIVSSARHSFSYLYLSSGDPKITTRRWLGQDWSPWKEERSRLPRSPTSSSLPGSMRLLPPPRPATSAASSLRRLRFWANLRASRQKHKQCGERMTNLSRPVDLKNRPTLARPFTTVVGISTTALHPTKHLELQNLLKISIRELPTEVNGGKVLCTIEYTNAMACSPINIGKGLLMIAASSYGTQPVSTYSSHGVFLFIYSRYKGTQLKISVSYKGSCLGFVF